MFESQIIQWLITMNLILLNIALIKYIAKD